MDRPDGALVEMGGEWLKGVGGGQGAEEGGEIFLCKCEVESCLEAVRKIWILAEPIALGLWAVQLEEVLRLCGIEMAAHDRKYVLKATVVVQGGRGLVGVAVAEEVEGGFS